MEKIEPNYHTWKKKCPNPILDFSKSPFSEVVVSTLIENYSTPTPIQSQAWPIVMSGKDMVGCAKTGSGKTLAYILPALEHIRIQNNSQFPTALVLAPTRELVQQIQEEADKFAHYYRVHTTSCFGGQGNRSFQYRQLQNRPQLVVAAPGRLLDFLTNKIISVSNVSYLVLDEADRMLDMGFEPQIRNIVNRIIGGRQTLMFSATWPKVVQTLCIDYLNNPVRVNIGSMELSANSDIKQEFILCEEDERQNRLIELLKNSPPKKTLIFVDTKVGADFLARAFVSANLHNTLPFATLHGDKAQSHRNNIMEDFKSDKLLVVIATDVASRGIDVKDIDIVINYNMPPNIESYIHRIGRTARAGKKGLSLTFLSSNDQPVLRDLMDVLEKAGQPIPPQFNQLSPMRSNRTPMKNRSGSSQNDYGDKYFNQPPFLNSVRPPFNYMPKSEVPLEFIRAKQSMNKNH